MSKELGAWQMVALVRGDQFQRTVGLVSEKPVTHPEESEWVVMCNETMGRFRIEPGLRYPERKDLDLPLMAPQLVPSIYSFDDLQRTWETALHDRRAVLNWRKQSKDWLTTQATPLEQEIWRLGQVLSNVHINRELRFQTTQRILELIQHLPKAPIQDMGEDDIPWQITN